MQISKTYRTYRIQRNITQVLRTRCNIRISCNSKFNRWAWPTELPISTASRVKCMGLRIWTIAAPFRWVNSHPWTHNRSAGRTPSKKVAINRFTRHCIRSQTIYSWCNWRVAMIFLSLSMMPPTLRLEDELLCQSSLKDNLNWITWSLRNRGGDRITSRTSIRSSSHPWVQRRSQTWRTAHQGARATRWRPLVVPTIPIRRLNCPMASK